VFLINFKSLSLKNFLSVGKTPVKIQLQAGIGVITGVNKDKEDSKNGVGKSTIVDALYFALYGTTIRDLGKDYIINSINKKDCEVVLEFLHENEKAVDCYVITRQLAPSKCSIFKNGTDITLSTIAKTNEYIQSIIRTPGNVFQNSVIMSLNSTLPFMVLSKIDKRKFIENILNLQVFSKMLTLAREEFNNNKKDYEVFYTKKQTLESVVNNNTKQIEFFEESKKTRINTILSKIENTNNEIKNIQASVVSIPDELVSLLLEKEKRVNQDLLNNNVEYEKTLQKTLEIKSEINTYKKQLLSLTGEQALCPTCKRPFADNDVSHKHTEIEKHQTLLAQLAETYKIAEQDYHQQKANKETITNTLNEIATQHTKIKNQITKNQVNADKVQFLKKSVNNLIVEIQNIKKEENTDLVTNTKTLQLEIKELAKKIDTLNNDLHVLDAIKFVVSEEGVKTYIVKKILEVMNSRVNYYLQKLNANCICTFNELFEDKIIDEYGNEKTYFNFSGGEKKRIDLACLFAFLDIRRLQGDVNFSTIFYDELIDSALDEKGIELTLDILRDRFEQFKESCYIITHRGSSVLQGIDSVIKLEKRNGQTYLIE
jgi:DNA repair exonuclease SbcCD ATPase subunit